MPVFTDYSVYDRDLDRSVVIATDVRFEGQVVAIKCEEKRIMSDVWDYVQTAIVAELDADLAEVDEIGYTFENVHLGIAGSGISATIDAPVELVEAHKSYLKRQEEARKALEEARNRSYAAVRLARAREEEARIAALPKRGDKVEIRVDGRCRNPQVKAANGKVGQVFWVRDGRYGVTLSDVRDSRGNFTDVVWVYESQIRKVA